MLRFITLGCEQGNSNQRLRVRRIRWGGGFSIRLTVYADSEDQIGEIAGYFPGVRFTARNGDQVQILPHPDNKKPTIMLVLITTPEGRVHRTEHAQVEIIDRVREASEFVRD
jgi:hypothetical protein